MKSWLSLMASDMAITSAMTNDENSRDAMPEKVPSQGPEQAVPEPGASKSKLIATQRQKAITASGLPNFGTRWSGFIGILVGLLAVCLTVYQAWATHRHERLMVRPYVRAVWYLEGIGRRNALYLENSGLGPAIVKSLTVHVDGHNFDLLAKGMHREFIKILGTRTKGIAPSDFCFANTQPETGFVIRTDRPEPLLLLTNNALVADACTGLFALALSGGPIKFDVRYESFAEDAFELHQSVSMP